MKYFIILLMVLSFNVYSTGRITDSSSKISILFLHESSIDYVNAKDEAEKFLFELKNSLNNTSINYVNKNNDFIVETIDFLPVKNTHIVYWQNPSDGILLKLHPLDHTLISNIKNNTNGFENLNDIVNKTDADLVVYMTDSAKGYGRASRFGKDGNGVYNINSIPIITIAYNYDDKTDDNNYNAYIFSHEIGHPLGGVDNDGGIGLYPFSKGLSFVDTINGLKTYTIMEYPNSVLDVMHQNYSTTSISTCGFNHNLLCGDVNLYDMKSTLEYTIPKLASLRERNLNSFITTSPTEQTDLITGSNLNDIFNLLDGDDVLYASSGEDLFILGQGNDTFFVQDRIGETTIVDFTSSDRIGFESNSSGNYSIYQENTNLVVQGDYIRVVLIDFYKAGNFASYRIQSINGKDYLYGVTYRVVTANSDFNSSDLTLKQSASKEDLKNSIIDYISLTLPNFEFTIKELAPVSGQDGSLTFNYDIKIKNAKCSGSCTSFYFPDIIKDSNYSPMINPADAPLISLLLFSHIKSVDSNYDNYSCADAGALSSILDANGDSYIDLGIGQSVGAYCHIQKHVNFKIHRIKEQDYIFKIVSS